MSAPARTHIPLISPGDILLEEFMRPLKLSVEKVAQAIGVPPLEIRQVIKGTRAITPEMALRLGACFNTSARFWVNLQSNFALRKIEIA